MTTTKKIVIIALMAFVTGFFLATKIGCNGPANIVYIPEKSGSIKATQPVVHDKVIKYLPGKTIISKQDSLDLVDAQAEIKRVMHEYDLLDADFAKYNDSVQQAKYREVIKPKHFQQAFSDTLVDGLINGIVFNGEVQKGMIFDYKVKKQKVELPSKEMAMRFYLGGGAGINSELNQGYYSFNAGIQDSKNRIYTGEFQKIGPVKYYGVRTLIPILTVYKKKQK